MFFDRFKELCAEKGVSVYKACTDIGLNRSAVNKWKDGGQPNGTLARLAKYFHVSTDYLVGNVSEPNFHLDNERILREINSYDEEGKPTQDGERKVSDEDIKFALFGGDGEITDAMYEEVKRFARMVKLREEAERKKE